MISDYEHQIKWIVCAQTVATAIFYIVCLTLLDYRGNILSNLGLCFILWLRVYSNLIFLHLSFYSFNLGIFGFTASAKLLIFQLYGDFAQKLYFQKDSLIPSLGNCHGFHYVSLKLERIFPHSILYIGSQGLSSCGTRVSSAKMLELVLMFGS